MFSISFEADVASFERELPRWAQDRVPSIARNALNDTAPEARDAENAKIKGVFDRPTPYTQRAVVFPRHLRATKADLTATIMVRDEGGGTPPAKYLMPGVRGMARAPKPFEKRLRAAGIMRPDEFATVAIGYRRNAYGNIPGPTYVAILSQLKAFAEVGFRMNETKRSRARAGAKRTRYFVPDERSGLRRGVYERMAGKRVRAVLIFVRQPIYSKRYDYGQAGIAKARRVFAGHFQRYWQRELAKAGGGSF